jgi:hypothetical protein
MAYPQPSVEVLFEVSAVASAPGTRSIWRPIPATARRDPVQGRNPRSSRHTVGRTHPANRTERQRIETFEVQDLIQIGKQFERFSHMARGSVTPALHRVIKSPTSTGRRTSNFG